MILLRLLDHDLHRAKRGIEAVPMWIETPAKPGFLPAVVSLSTPKFAVARKLTSDGKLRAGVFSYDSDRVDEIIPGLMDSAYQLSVQEKWPNIFKSARPAFEYVQKHSGTTAQPHLVLIPKKWSDAKLSKWAGKANVSKADSKDLMDKAVEQTYVTVLWKICRVYRCDVSMPVFASRPDFVGMYTQLVGGKTSILLHNIRAGLAFCP